MKFILNANSQKMEKKLILNCLTRKKISSYLVMNTSGQASITDAMYFLIIVMALASLMFFFSSTYGQSINVYLGDKYKSDYVTSALETVFYSSVQRNPDATDASGNKLTLQTNPEVDNFFAALKEDFFAHPESVDPLSERMKKCVLKKVRSIMAPVSAGFDYMFYVYVPSLVYFTNPETGEKEEAKQDESAKKFSNVVVLLLKKLEPETKKAEYYFCRPEDFDKVSQRLLPRLGEVSKPAEVRIILPHSKFNKLQAQANILMWIPTSFPDDFAGNGFGDLRCNLEVPTGWLT